VARLTFYVFLFQKERTLRNGRVSLLNYDETKLLNINIQGFEQKHLHLNGQFVSEELDVNCG
jgi:hypothetical protein